MFFVSCIVLFQKSHPHLIFPFLVSVAKFLFSTNVVFFFDRFRLGVPDDRKIWSATAIVNSQYHETLRNVHKSFLSSGSNAITTNSYGIVPGVGFTNDEITKYVTLAGKIARQALTERQFAAAADNDNEGNNAMITDNDDDEPFIFGSLGPLIESYRPDLILPHNQGVEMYKLMFQALLPNVDLCLGETMSCINESKQIIDAMIQLQLEHEQTEEQEQNGQESATPTSTSTTTFNTHIHPLLLSFTLNSKGNFRDGQPVEDGINELLDYISSCKKHNVQCKLLTST